MMMQLGDAQSLGQADPLHRCAELARFL